MARTEKERLTQSPGQILKHPHTGADYYSGEQIITHLNHALGPMGWDWEPLEHGYDQEADEVWVLGKLTARFVMDAMNDDDYERQTTVKIDRGWQPVNRKKTGQALSMGNDYKGADTDALKRCARMLGVGLDAWAKDAPPARHDPPKPMKTKADLEADLKRGLDAGRKLGLVLADIDTSKMDRAALIESVQHLADMIREAKSAKAQAS